MIIIGAGYAGLIAGFIFQRAEILEKAARSALGHRALLRFRSPAIGELTGIPFEKVTVHKGIWDGGWVAPNIASGNRYARKVTGGLVADRSIWNVDTCERWVAPRDFREQLIEALGARVHWLQAVDPNEIKDAISTIPLPAYDETRVWPASPVVTSSRLFPRVNVHQTVYFPTLDHPLARASFVGSLLILEWAWMPKEDDAALALYELRHALGLPELPLLPELTEYQTQSGGKISPINEAERKALITRLTVEKGIYSLGRYATWRPGVMLDDLPHDCAVIKQLMNADTYSRRIAAL